MLSICHDGRADVYNHLATKKRKATVEAAASLSRVISFVKNMETGAAKRQLLLILPQSQRYSWAKFGKFRLHFQVGFKAV